MNFHPTTGAAWLATKIVDTFHHQDHVDPTCKEKYNPADVPVIKSINPHYNTQADEQTFARFKHILCAMNKTHRLFYFTT